VADAAGPLAVGYVMQSDAADMAVETGPQGHVRAIYDGLAEAGHRLRMVAVQTVDTLAEVDGRPNRVGPARPGGETDPLRPRMAAWSDDLAHWFSLRCGPSQSPVFRGVERPVRRLQSRLGLPYLRYFDSYRFGDGCATALAGFDAIYERQGMLSYGGLMAARRLGVPLVYEVNGDMMAEHRLLEVPLSRAQWAIMHYVSGWMYRRADHIVAVGETIRDTLVGRWRLDPDRVSVVTNGVAVERFAEPVDAAAVRSRFDCPHDPLVVFVGSFQPWHGVDQLVEAFATVAAAIPTSGLLLVGDGALRQPLEERARSLGLANRVVMPGMVGRADIPAVLAIADVAVLYQPSSAGQVVETPLKLFEYMAAGKAIVAPDFPTMRRVLDDGRTGRLVPPDSPAALARALIELLGDDDLRWRLGTAAHCEAQAKHSWQRAVRQIEGLLLRLVEERAR
jgi:glycosyltransferase involved in cell wall biosynthesis